MSGPVTRARRSPNTAPGPSDRTRAGHCGRRRTTTPAAPNLRLLVLCGRFCTPPADPDRPGPLPPLVPRLTSESCLQVGEGLHPQARAHHPPARLGLPTATGLASSLRSPAGPGTRFSVGAAAAATTTTGAMAGAAPSGFAAPPGLIAETTVGSWGWGWGSKIRVPRVRMRQVGRCREGGGPISLSRARALTIAMARAGTWRRLGRGRRRREGDFGPRRCRG